MLLLQRVLPSRSPEPELLGLQVRGRGERGDGGKLRHQIQVEEGMQSVQVLWLLKLYVYSFPVKSFEREMNRLLDSNQIRAG